MNYGRLYGAIPDPAGTQFRVWAPSIEEVVVDKVELLLYNGSPDPEVIPMQRKNDSDWECYLPSITTGQRYNFRINGNSEKLDPWARHVTHSNGISIVEAEDNYVWQCTNFQMPSHNELVIYQMHVRTYPDNDRGPANQLSAVTNDLWYLQKLGVNAIQLLPAAEFEGDNSWGYNPACIYAIESSYGGPTALKKMVDGAHARGIAVFLDVVYNHLSPRGSKGLYQFTPWHRHINLPGHKELETGGIYFYYDDRAHTDWDDVGRPDFGRPEVRDFIRENALMWLNEYHIDGIRFDSVCNIYNKNGRAEDDKADIPDGIRLLRSINMAVRNTQPRKITIAEDLQKGKWITEEATGEWDGGLGFNTQWNETFYGAIKEGVTKLSDQDRDMWKIADALKFKYNDEAFQRVIYTENHDKVAEDEKNPRPGRLPNQIEPNHVDDGWYAKKRSTLATALLMTAPGIPMLHQGQEILEWRLIGEKPENGVDWNRFCLKGNCDLCPSFVRGNGEEGCNPDHDPNGRFEGIYKLYRDLIHLRRNWFNNTRGLRGQHINVFHVNDKDKVIAYHRWENGGAGDDVVVVANFSNNTYSNYGYKISFPRPGRWKVRFNSDWNGYDPTFHNTETMETDAHAEVYDDNMPCCGNISIGPYSAIILSQD